uniref:Ras-GEF domain-containing protein n=1 Tax=Myotis lucifugus TaxID=59463 RepID=G1Q1Q1_MYOLU
ASAATDIPRPLAGGRIGLRWTCQSSNRDIPEGLVNRFNYSTSLDPGKVHRATDTIQGRTQCAAEFTLRQCEALRLRALQKGTLEKVAASLIPAFPAGKIPHICTLMPTHPAFSRAQWFLDELLTSSDSIKVFSTSGGAPPHNDQGDTPQEQLAKATACVMGTWPDRVQYLGQHLFSSWFIVRQALVLHSRPAPHLVGLVRSLWVELAHLEPTEAQWEGEGTAVGGQNPLKGIRILPVGGNAWGSEPVPEPPPELKLTPEPEEGPAPGLEPGLAVVVLEPSGPPALIRIPTTEPAPRPTTDFRRAGAPKHLIREEKLNILAFPPRLVAEQLTAMDVELFKKVLPHQCLGSIWSQRAKPGKEHVASTVIATVRQFCHVATCVITTCLWDPSMMARDRAKVVAHWIKVAKECRSLRNFSSLHAILAALQSVAMYRLKKTWGKVSRRWAVIFQKLCEGENSISRAQLIKKQPSRFSTLVHYVRGSDKRLQKKFAQCVPLLETFILDLRILDISKKDNLEEGLLMPISEHRPQELNITKELVLLQEAAQESKIEPEEEFKSWFWALDQLSEEESYIWSCLLEPQSKVAT